MVGNSQNIMIYLMDLGRCLGYLLSESSTCKYSPNHHSLAALAILILYRSITSQQLRLSEPIEVPGVASSVHKGFSRDSQATCARQ